jgi:hypothetical protein
MSFAPVYGDMSSQYLSGQRGWQPSGQFGLGGMRQDQQLGISHDGPGSMGNPFIKGAQPAVHFNAQRDAQMGMQDRMPKINYGPGPFGQSLQQENQFRAPSPIIGQIARRPPGGFGGGGFGGGSQGIDQFMDFMQQMMQMFKQFNSQGGGGGGYGQRRGQGGFPQPPQQYGRQPQPARIMTQGPASLMGQIMTRGPDSSSYMMPQSQFGWGGPSGRERSLGIMTQGPESMPLQTQGHF